MPSAGAGYLLVGIGAIMSAVNGWARYRDNRRERRRKSQHDAWSEQLDGWEFLVGNLRKEVDDCHRRGKDLRVELSKVRTDNVALRKIIEGQFPPHILAGLPDPDMKGNP